MKKKISILLIAMVIMDLVDGDFATISFLHIVKWILYIVCFALLFTTKESTLGLKEPQ